MSLFVPLRRATLLIPSGPASDPDRKHLFVLLTDPVSFEGRERQVLMVSISSLKPGLPHDPTCVLHPGDHSFIRHKSFVVYQRARIEAADKLLRGVRQGLLEPQSPMSEVPFAHICRGLIESPLTPLRIKRWYEEWSVAQRPGA